MPNGQRGGREEILLRAGRDVISFTDNLPERSQGLDLSPADAPLTSNWASAYLAHRLPGPTPSQVDVMRFPRGVSRETWRLTALWPDGQRKRFAIRRNLASVSVDGIPIEREFQIYSRLAQTKIPIAKALWFEDDPQWRPGGRLFYVRDWIDGDWRIPGFEDSDPAKDDLRIAASKEHLGALARVHACDWRALRLDELLPVPKSPERAAREMIERYEQRVLEFRLEPLPLVTEAIARLKARTPESTGDLCLCKGTNGLGEEVWRDGRIVAMSDWELAEIADPAFDFAQLQGLVPEIAGRWGLKPALDYYHGLTGRHIRAEQIEFYRAVYCIQQIAYASHSASAIHRDEDDLVRLCWLGTEVLHKGVDQLARYVGLVWGS